MQSLPTSPGASPTARNVLVVAVTSGLNVAAMMMYAPVLSLILRDIGASDIVIGTANAIWLVLSAICQYFGGRLADRFGRVPVMAWPGVLSGIALAACALARSWPLFVVLYAFYHAGHGIQGPVFASIIGESVPAQLRGRAFSRVEVAIGIGVVIGPLTGSFLMGVIGVNWLLVVAGALLVIASSLRLVLLRETKPEDTHQATFALRELARPPLARAMVVLVCVNALLTLTLWGPFISLHAADVMGLSRPFINQLAAIGSAVGIAATFVAGHVVTRAGAPRVLRFALPLMAVAGVLWSLQRTTLLIVGAYIAMYGTFEFMMISSDTFKVQAVPDRVRGRALGAMGMANNLIIAPLIPVASALRASFGSGAPFWLSLLPAVTGLWAIASWTRHQSAARPVVEVVRLQAQDQDKEAAPHV